MQKFTLFLSLLFLTNLAVAQKNESSLIQARIKDGSIMVGGNFSGSYQRYDNDITNEEGRIITLNFNTKSGYFFFPDFAVGLNLGVNFLSDNRNSETSEDLIRQTYVLGGPFVRYYWDNGIFAEGSAGVGVDVTKGRRGRDLLSAAAGVGYAYFLRDNVTIEPMLAFNYYRITSGGGTDKVRANQFGPIFSIGLQAYLWSPSRTFPTK